MSEEEQIEAVINRSLEEDRSASESNDEIEDTEEEEDSTPGKFNSIGFRKFIAMLKLIFLNYLL